MLALFSRVMAEPQPDWPRQALVTGRPDAGDALRIRSTGQRRAAERLGVARIIGRKHYTARRAAAELDRLLTDARYAERATMAARRVGQEEAVRVTCDAVEECAGVHPEWARQA